MKKRKNTYKNLLSFNMNFIYNYPYKTLIGIREGVGHRFCFGILFNARIKNKLAPHVVPELHRKKISLSQIFGEVPPMFKKVVMTLLFIYLFYK